MTAPQSICSFCGKKRPAEDCFYVAPGPRVCRDCLQLCAEIFEDEARRLAKGGPIATPAAPCSICRSEQGRVILGPPPLRICEECVAMGWGALRGAG